MFNNFIYIFSDGVKFVSLFWMIIIIEGNSNEILSQEEHLQSPQQLVDGCQESHESKHC